MCKSFSHSGAAVILCFVHWVMFVYGPHVVKYDCTKNTTHRMGLVIVQFFNEIISGRLSAESYRLFVHFLLCCTIYRAPYTSSLIRQCRRSSFTVRWVFPVCKRPIYGISILYCAYSIRCTFSSIFSYDNDKANLNN